MHGKLFFFSLLSPREGQHELAFSWLRECSEGGLYASSCMYFYQY